MNALQLHDYSASPSIWDPLPATQIAQFERDKKKFYGRFHGPLDKLRDGGPYSSPVESGLVHGQR